MIDEADDPDECMSLDMRAQMLRFLDCPDVFSAFWLGVFAADQPLGDDYPGGMWAPQSAVMLAMEQVRADRPPEYHEAGDALVRRLRGEDE